MSTQLVSIIIPTFNRAHLIKETLNSIILQSYSNWECIVIDDGSSDGTEKLILEYCKKDPRFQYFKRPIKKSKGANACRNYGFELSKGTYINWFDDDDLMHEDKLFIQVNNLENSDFNFSVCQTFIFKDSLKNILGLRSEHIYSDTIFEDYVSQKISWLTMVPLWKKKFLEQLDSLFDEELQAAQEWEFHCRVLFDSPKYNVIDKPLVYIRKHPNSISYNNESNKRKLNYFLARKKVYKFLADKGIKNNFLRNYLISHYRYFLRKRNFKLAFYILVFQVLFNKKLLNIYKFKLLSAFIIYPIFNKGEMLFKGKPRQY